MTSGQVAQLVLRHEPAKKATLSAKQPLTIGRAATNMLCMPTTEGVAEHHAVVRWSRSHGWLVCDWGCQEGTYMETRFSWGNVDLFLSSALLRPKAIHATALNLLK